MAGLIKVNTNALSKFGRTLRDADPKVVAAFRDGLRVAAGDIGDQARTNAAWSTKIPGSIRVGVNGSQAYVRAGGMRAPAAPAFENHGQPGSFRHPVFGNRDNWVAQMARPFLQPALDEKVDAVADALAETVRKSIEEA